MVVLLGDDDGGPLTVKLKPECDLFPVRAKYDDRSYTIGLNYLTTNKPQWYTLADCIVSKLLTGKTPTIELARTYEPGPPQQGLQAVNIMGRDDYRINPETDDLFTRLIDLRDEAKTNNDPIEKTLKIIANSTSYGIFIEVNRDNAPKSKSLDVYGLNGICRATNTIAIEEPGRYFNPLLGVLITGAARLMRGIAEKKVIDYGLDWAFCDTDSLALIKPKNISRRIFHNKVQINSVTPKWKSTKKYPVPDDWTKFISRAALRAGKRHNKRATHPVNALLNYAYGVITARTPVQLISEGYDPTIGIMHDRKNFRGTYPAFALDHIEPVRPIVDRAILDLIQTETFTGADFAIQDDGVCRLNPELARRVVQMVEEAVTKADPERMTAYHTKGVVSL